MFKTGLAFVLGAAAGSAVTWYLVRNYYDQSAKEAIDAYRERVSASIEDEEDSEDDSEYEEIVRPGKKPELKEYVKNLNDAGYASYFKAMTGEETENDESADTTVISPEEFASNDEYEVVSLIYYANGVLTDDRGNPIEDIEGLIGSEALSCFGKYEDDSVHVVDDENQIYYEILADSGNFTIAKSDSEEPMEE